MERYDIIEFKRKGTTSLILGGILKLFNPSWDGWGWHLGIIWDKYPGYCLILESISSGVRTNTYPYNELHNTRCHHWLDVVSDDKAEDFIIKHIGKQYDVAIYFWTAAQYLIRHFFNHRIPRLLDNRYTCWELVTEFCRAMGKPINNHYDCPMLPDILEQLKKEDRR